jgi:hypothetical protein
MAQRDRHFSLKALALGGAGFVLLVVDVVLLSWIIGPAAASTRTVPTGLSARATQGAELALILPTRDHRTPWPTKIPMPTASPWLISTETPEPPPAIQVLAVSTALPQSTFAPTMPVLAESTALSRSTLAPATPLSSAKTSSAALVTTPTPTLQPAAMATSAPDTGGGSPTATLGPRETPVGAPSETPAGDPTETPVANPGETPLPPAPPRTYDDLPDFESYMRMYRNAIESQPFDIVSLGLDTTDSAIPRFVLEVAGSESQDDFAAQPATDVLDYSRHFLDDAKRYLGGEYCAVADESTYKASNKDACLNTPAWCQVGAYDQATNTWSVTWAYVRGSYTGGPYALEVWNADP